MDAYGIRWIVVSTGQVPRADEDDLDVEDDLGQSDSKKVRAEENEDSSEMALQLSVPTPSPILTALLSSAWLLVSSSYYSSEYFFEPSFEPSMHQGQGLG